MEGFLPIFFLLVVLKIPVFFALWLIWWASKAPEQEGLADDSDGGFGRRPPFRPRPRGPHPAPVSATRARRGAPPTEPALRPMRGDEALPAHKFRWRGTPSTRPHTDDVRVRSRRS
jgi:hypothetical protein